MKRLALQMRSNNAAATDLQWLIRLRWCLLLLALGAILFTHFVLGVPLWLTPLLLTLAVLGVANILAWSRLRYGGPVHPFELVFHLFMDVMGLAILLHFSGGWNNPFVFALLLPVAVGAAEGSPSRAAWVALAAVIAYSMLAFGEVTHASAPVATAISLHLWGMWVCFALSAGMITFFVLKVARTLQDKERELAAARERELRDQHLVTMATMATGAAHELGTPLGTMAVVLGDLHRNYQDSPDLREEFALLQGQIYRCKEILGRLAGAAGASRAEAGQGQSLDVYLHELTQRWRSNWSDVALNCDLDGSLPAPRIVIDETLTQTLFNLLNNAAGSKARTVTVVARWTPDELIVTISDNGPGFPPELIETLGHQPLARRHQDGDGLGIGLYLAAATLERLGGELVLENAPVGGAVSKLVLPLARLRLASPDTPVSETSHVPAAVNR